MAGFIPENIIDQILDRCDIAEIISSYIPLKRAGRSYKALCPFHHEKTPSFIVNPEKGIFHCFGCGAGGNALSFIMKYERLEFPEVARMLAKRAGIAIPESAGAHSKESLSLIEAMYNIHGHATAYFQNMLMSPAGKRAGEYLAQRGILSETVRHFKLGFAPDSWDGLLAYLKKKGFKEDLMEKSGLIIPRTDGSGYYDRFRNRLIFPIFDQRDKVIAFAGRVLDESLPKYMNSPETQIYSKSRTLFGLNFAKRHISEKDAVVITEGYTDVIMPYQNGISNIVASCGTALTPDHIRMLKRHTRNVVTVYDSDKAGELATLRGLDLLLADDMHVGIAKLPQGFDPDTFVKKNGAQAFEELLKKPIPLFEYKLNVLTEMYGAGNAESKIKIADEMLRTISRVNNAVLKSEYVKKLAESLDLDENALRTEAKKVDREYDGMLSLERLSFTREDIAPLAAADKIVIGLMIDNNNLIEFVRERVDSSEFCNKLTQRIVKSIFELHEQNRPISYAALISHMQAEGVEGILSEVATSYLASVDKKRNLEDCIVWIKRQNLKKDLDGLHNQIKEAETAGEEDKLDGLITKYNSLIREYSRYASSAPKIAPKISPGLNS